MSPHDVVITGIGLVSSLGEGNDVHWEKMTADHPVPVIDTERFAPFTVHPLPEIDWSLQIAKRGDQRQMETWQRLGTYVAGLALDDAGMKGDESLCATMDMIVAAGGGERDQEVDESILAASLDTNDRAVLLNQKLMTDLRPTLFLAQLSNLLAGNISIVHKVTGSSRTFMGEEGAGVAAVETAAARIRSGQSSHALVGAAFQTEHPDMLLAYQLGGQLQRGQWQPVWNRDPSQGGGVFTGSGGAFLVLESRKHAEARGARIYARIGNVVSDRVRRSNGTLENRLREMAAGLAGETGPHLVLSAASGAYEATIAERKALEDRYALRGLTTLTGHVKEAQFPFAMAFAALAVAHGEAYPPFDPSEPAFAGDPRTVLATAVGSSHFEGMALIGAA
ncbi:beta-ketoacyl-ACP synthase [Mesorhizobium koreense]|uniref:beta-ketoacyl-ACP synthase n=1 Tax=Mesorhizobium koreense TaxID=3074855 RepID=UPI00287BBEB2|nr:beta-ketoacyl-ACP synthase [Mesorhizobium sp. WR6]